MQGAQALSNDDIKKCLDYFQQTRGQFAIRDQMLFVIGVYSGFRISELLSIKIRDVVYENGSIKEVVSLTKNCMKGKKKGRMVYLNSEVKKALIQYLDYWPRLYHSRICPEVSELYPDYPLFISRKFHVVDGILMPKTLMYTSYCKIFKKLFKKLNMEHYSTHSMRKTFAKNVYKNSGHNIELTKQALGHSSVTITQRYLNTCSDELKKAMLELKYLDEDGKGPELQFPKAVEEEEIDAEEEDEKETDKEEEKGKEEVSTTSKTERKPLKLNVSCL